MTQNSADRPGLKPGWYAVKNVCSRFKAICVILVVLIAGARESDPGTRLAAAGRSIGSDYKYFYSLTNACKFGAGLAVSGILANTSVDNYVRAWYQGSVRNETTDRCAAIVKPLGNGKYTLPVYCMAAVLGILSGGSGTCAILAAWGSSNLRVLLVGVPALLFFQDGIGSSRPGENNSNWHIFRDKHGVSGHCFMGALPFLVAGGLTANPYLKAAFYLASPITGVSRINDDEHFFSQVLLGWWLAWLAAAVVRINRRPKIDKLSKPARRISLPALLALAALFSAPPLAERPHGIARPRDGCSAERSEIPPQPGGNRIP